jgi:hypothetical protein
MRLGVNRRRHILGPGISEFQLNKTDSRILKVISLVDRLCGLVVRLPDHRTEMYYVSCEVRTGFIYVMQKKVDRLCGLVVRVPGYTTEMYCVSCEVRTEFIYVM